jgi:hypothetical protein
VLTDVSEKYNEKKELYNGIPNVNVWQVLRIKCKRFGRARSHIYIPDEQGGPVIPRELGSLHIASYD